MHEANISHFNCLTVKYISEFDLSTFQDVIGEHFKYEQLVKKAH